MMAIREQQRKQISLLTRNEGFSLVWSKNAVHTSELGKSEGSAEGRVEGNDEGSSDGRLDGLFEGNTDGRDDGEELGASDGILLGDKLGCETS
jgi:hypothetical protein